MYLFWVFISSLPIQHWTSRTKYFTHTANQVLLSDKYWLAEDDISANRFTNVRWESFLYMNVQIIGILKRHFWQKCVIVVEIRSRCKTKQVNHDYIFCFLRVEERRKLNNKTIKALWKSVIERTIELNNVNEKNCKNHLSILYTKNNNKWTKIKPPW